MSETPPTDTGTNDTSKRALSNNGFWPDVYPDRPPREHYKVISALTASPMLENALIEAMMPVNTALMPWQAKKVEAGYPTLAAVPVPVWQTENVFNRLYLRAVFSTAFAKLLETYPDTNTSPLNIDSAKAADSYWRDATWAVSELLGKQVKLRVT